MGKTVLITGVAGFIGSHLAVRLVELGHRVTGIDAFSDYYDPRLKGYNLDAIRDAERDFDGEFEFTAGDVRSRAGIRQYCREADAVFHLAAQAGVRHSVDNPVDVNDINVNGTMNLLEACREFGVDRFVLASTSSVYGGRDAPFREEQPLRPMSPYAASKVAAEQYAATYSHVYDLPTVRVRFFTVYGPRMRPGMAISNFVEAALTGDTITIFGDGEQTRDFTHVDDIVDGCVELLHTSAADGEAINLGSGERITIRDLVKVVQRAVAVNLGDGASVPIEHEPPRSADARHTLADVSKAERVIGYSPEYTLKAGIEEYVSWFQKERLVTETEGTA